MLPDVNNSTLLPAVPTPRARISRTNTRSAAFRTNCPTRLVPQLTSPLTPDTHGKIRRSCGHTRAPSVTDCPKSSSQSARFPPPIAIFPNNPTNSFPLPTPTASPGPPGASRRSPMPRISQQFLAALTLLALLQTGCGTALQRNGTEQLLLSDSVDRAIDQLDLSGLAGRRVYLDTEYMKTFKGNNIYINSDYMISALRQKMTTSGLRVETNRTEADYVLEARVGALGTDTMEVTYGIPSSNGLGAAATAVSGVPAVPLIPEISFGKRNGAVGVSKVVVYAYHRETGVPVWQSGAAVARSDSRDSWLLGIGPLTQGSVYEGPMLAGNRINPPFGRKSSRPQQRRPLTIADRQQYVHPAVLERQLADAKAEDNSGVTPAAAPGDTNAEPGAQPSPSQVQPASHQPPGLSNPPPPVPPASPAPPNAEASNSSAPSTTKAPDAAPQPLPELPAIP